MANPLIEIDMSEITTFLKVAIPRMEKGFNSRGLVGDLGNFISARIKVRTTQGKDVDLKDFKPYAPSTKKFRSKRGRQTGRVDLFFRGQMLAALGSTVKSDTEAVVKFLSAAEEKKALGHQLGTKRLPQRKFVGIGEKDKTTMDGIKKLIKQHTDAAVREAK